MFSTHTYVGGDWTKDAVFIQHSTKLCLIQAKEVCAEFFSQVVINKFANFGQMRFKEPHGPKEELASAIAAFLTQKRAMLEEYFSFVINDEGKMLAFPLLLDNYVPDFGNLPMLIVRLATDVDWEVEQDCFESLSKEIGSFYAQPELSLASVGEKVSILSVNVLLQLLMLGFVFSGKR
jgi:DNA mismatch repair protein MLH1